jgi:Quinohemoprotein amine dehydrogenase, gamma subunit
MSHLKPLNTTADRVLSADPAGSVMQPMQTVFPLGCTTALNPGVEVDAAGSVASLCTPWEADVYGCSEPCYWPASVPDSMTYPEWNDGTTNGENDWRSLGQIYPNK